MAKLVQIDDPQAVVHALMRADFVAFLMRAFPHVQGGATLTPGWHIEAIAASLADVTEGRSRRLLINLPPRNLKSLMVSVAYVAWRLGHDPALSFVCVSYSNELSAKHARDCRSIMQSDWYRALFPRTRIAASRSAVHDFDTSAGGGRLATSIGGTLTGRGGDIIIIDDPIKPDEAHSDSARKSVNDWFHSTLASRLDDKQRGAIITVMQRLHHDDLCGMLLEEGGWDLLSLPAIAPDDAVIPLQRGRVHQRKAGDVLHPAREPLAALEAVKASLGSINFAAQYQQDPVPAGGNIIKAEWLHSYDGVPSKGEVVQSWDTASKDGLHNDWSVCITARVLGRIIYIVDVLRARLTFPDLQRAAIAAAQQHRPSALLIEDQASGTQLIQALRSTHARRVPRPIARRPEQDKQSRLAGVSAMIEAGQLLLPTEAPWLAAFQGELLSFPHGRFADQVDALSQLLAWVRLRGQHSYGPPEGPYIVDAGSYLADHQLLDLDGDEYWDEDGEGEGEGEGGLY